MNYVIGVDFGTDSVRSLVVNVETGQELGSHVHYYSRWKEGKFCNPATNQFRQHPLDYIEGLDTSIKNAIKNSGEGIENQVIGIGVDTTGSTPVAVDINGTPLSLKEEFSDNPNAMFVLWKDHTAIKEADEINSLCSSYHTDYSKYSGGIYSSEWFWAKILKVSRDDEAVRKAAYTWVEHCDWIPFLLTGGSNANQIKRSRCAAGHKALWHAEFGGLPEQAFFTTLDPILSDLIPNMFSETFTSDKSVGHLSSEWAKKLNLNQNVVVAVGAFDAHMGAVGGEIEPNYLSKVMGTSTCDILISPLKNKEKLIHGICGQVDGSVIPGFLGLEAGQSAFGDIYAWFSNMLLQATLDTIDQYDHIDIDQKIELKEYLKDKLLVTLSNGAENVPIGANGIISLDWMNGRRTPDANQSLKGIINGLNLGSNAFNIFRSLVEASCFGARKIVDRFKEEGVEIKGVIGLGGVAKKSPFIMQILSDILDLPIKIVRSEQTCALGAAMFAATAAGRYSNVSEALKQMGSGFEKTYSPIAENVLKYEKVYQKYTQLGDVIESNLY